MQCINLLNMMNHAWLSGLLHVNQVYGC